MAGTITLKQLYQLDVKEAESLSKEEIMEYNGLDDAALTADIKKFGIHHVELLWAINRRASLFLSFKQPLRKKIMQRYRDLNKRINTMATEKKKTDADPNAFFSNYSQLKYDNHEVTSVKYNTTMMEIKDKKMIEKTGGEDLLLVEYLRPIDMSPQQKNDVVKIIGNSFARSMQVVSHDNAEVAHTLLQDGSTRIILIKFIPKVADGPLMIHTVGAAVFTPVVMMRHENRRRGKNTGKISKVKPSTVNVVNMVQIGILEKWGRRNLGGLALEEAIWERLQENGHDLMIICGCTKHFYEKLEGLERYPEWLEEYPFNMDPPKGVKRYQHNRDIFFYQPLSDKFLSHVERTGHTFSFDISDYLKGYFGLLNEEDDPDSATEDETYADENVSPNAIQSETTPVRASDPFSGSPSS